MLKRYTPLKTRSELKRSGRLRPRAARHCSADREYTREAAYYLARHPYCMIWIFRHELDERLVIAMGGNVRGMIAPRSTQIHHRNKRWNDHRKLDQRWWMTACFEEHEWVEGHKDVARSLGLLLPIQADEEGRWGDGNQALPTDQLMASHAR